MYKVLHEAQTLALVGIFINLRRQAINDYYYFLFLKRNPKYFCKEEHDSIHLITLINYLESMGSL